MHKWCRDIGLQLDDSETQCCNSDASGPVDGSIPLELGRCSQAELVREVAPLVMVLAVLMLV